jgi:hypothetical protein
MNISRNSLLVFWDRRNAGRRHRGPAVADGPAVSSRTKPSTAEPGGISTAPAGLPPGRTAAATTGLRPFPAATAGVCHRQRRRYGSPLDRDTRPGTTSAACATVAPARSGIRRTGASSRDNKYSAPGPNAAQSTLSPTSAASHQSPPAWSRTNTCHSPPVTLPMLVANSALPTEAECDGGPLRQGPGRAMRKPARTGCLLRLPR